MKKKSFTDNMKFEKREFSVAYVGKKVEICFESCLNGCDVAVYDKNLNLIEPKYCTNLQGFDLGDSPDILKSLELRAVAFDKAQEFYERYELA